MTIYFPDVSSAQTGISFDGALAVIAKATEGASYLNPDYQAARERAQSAGSYFIAYHFLHQGSPGAQAQHAFNVVGGNVPLMLDFEPYPAIGSYPSLADAVAFIDAYRKLGGKCYFVYLPEWYWLDNLGSPHLTPLSQRGMLLWSSVYSPYSDADTSPGWLSYGGITPSVWQYTDGLNFNGFSVDFSAFRGHYAGKQDAASVAACLAEFKCLAAAGRFPAPPNPNWTFGKMRELSVLAAGYTSVSLEVMSPDSFIGSAPSPAPAVDHYEIAVLNNGKLLSSYPRKLPKDAAHATQNAQFGGLPQNTDLMAEARATDAAGDHAGPWVSISFRTGTRPAKKRSPAKAARADR